jgi:large subunit ribosomal protein L25
MERLALKAFKREKTGKSYAKKIRKKERIPAVVYKDGKAMALELELKNLIHVLHIAHTENVIVELDIENGEQVRKTAILKDIQYDSVKEKLIHVDFQEVTMEEIIKVKVPIELKGEAIGVKRDGGILEHLLREVEIECKAINIPEKIEVDISGLEIGHAINVEKLILPSGVKLMEQEGKVVVHVITPKVEEEVPAEEIEEEKVEPEVIKQKKEEEEKKEE